MILPSTEQRDALPLAEHVAAHLTHQADLERAYPSGHHLARAVPYDRSQDGASVVDNYAGLAGHRGRR